MASTTAGSERKADFESLMTRLALLEADVDAAELAAPVAALIAALKVLKKVPNAVVTASGRAELESCVNASAVT